MFLVVHFATARYSAILNQIQRRVLGKTGYNYLRVKTCRPVIGGDSFRNVKFPFGI